MVNRKCVVLVLAVAISTQFSAGKAEETSSADAEIAKTELFHSGHAGYRSYRIPSLAITRKGTILAAVAGRFDGHGDWSNTDTIMRRSSDGGKSWEDQRVVTDDGTNTVDNATFIIDPQGDTIYLMYQISYARAYLKRSVDEGVTWSPPQEITSVFEEFRTRDGYDWEVLAMGPGHGITLKNGRLVVPVWLSASRKHRPSISSTIYSDDHGATWHAGDVIVGTTEETPNPSEHMLVELADGRVMSNIRTESKMHRRLTSVSNDGTTGWSEPKFVDELYEPICMAGFTVVPSELNSSQQMLLFSHPNSGPTAPGYSPEWGDRARRNLTLRLSHDAGVTWQEGPIVESGPSAYSDLAVGQDGFIYVLYETGAGKQHGAFDPQGIVFARIPINIVLSRDLEN